MENDVSGLRRRLERLTKGRSTPEACTYSPTVVIEAGDPVPPAALRCPKCGIVQVQEISVVIVPCRVEDQVTPQE